MLLNPYRFQSGSAGLWTPLNMATVPQIYLDAQDSAVTDVGGACSAISNLGAMGSAGDFSQTTADRRPMILSAELNGKRVLRFNGSNQVLVAGSAEARAVFRAKSVAWGFFVSKKRGFDASPTARYILYAATGTGAARFAVTTGLNGAGQANKPGLYARRDDANAVGLLLGASVVQGIYALTFFQAAFSTTIGSILVDGAEAASAALTSAGATTSDTSASIDLSLGGYHSGVLGTDSDVAAVVIGNAALTTDDRQRLEGWAAHKYGLTANLPSGHPYKTVAPTV